MSENTQSLIGKLVVGEGFRDAIHIAVVPIIAGEDMRPGQSVGLHNGAGYTALRKDAIGVVDPFLERAVGFGQKFWLFLLPNTITSLRHQWAHPAFDGVDAKKAESERWLRDFIKNADCPGYDRVIGLAVGDPTFIGDDDYGRDHIDGEYMHFNGSDAHGDIPDEFWHHVEVVTGKKPLHRASYFSCSC